MPYRTTRRNFLQGGCAAAVGFWLRRSEAFAQGAPSPKRLLIIHHPVGTVRNNWVCQGTETNFTLSRILKPFEPVKSHMVVLDGIDIIARGVGGGHEQGTVTVMTGVRTTELYPGNGGDDPKAAGPSIDQRFLKSSTLLQGTPIASLQVSCDDRVDVGEISTRRLSYSGPAAPMDPYLVPHLTYQRVFGTMMAGAPNASADALAKARMLKKSVLDFNLRDLDKLRTLAPGSERERLDAHETAIRELERTFDAAPRDAGKCGITAAPPEIKPFLDSAGNRIGNGTYQTTNGKTGEQGTHEMIGKLHFEVIKAAFQCDLTRVVTFQWSPGTNHVAFAGFYDPEPGSIKMHHPLSHEFNNTNAPEFLTKIDTWYSERTSGFLQALKNLPDLAGGSMLDNTLVPYVTEVARADHTFNNTPFVVFGGPGVKIQGDRLKKYNPKRTVNDMWLACAKALEVPNLTTLGSQEMYTGPLDILMG
ncbi:MAG TPA: DUF1552 domain-containing protein [Polyangiales bacterium]|nr:DUF1552 domain-containing protein [Polyangiales bacterium]